MNVPFFDLRPLHRELRPELDAAWARVLESGSYILGDEVEAFERELAAFCGARHAIGVGNGLDALHLILRGMGITEGDEVLVPATTFIATWLAVSQAGARPVPVEVDPATANLDPARIEAAITPRTRAVIAVHLYGQPADMDALAEVCRPRGIRIVEDAAQAHGAGYRGRRAGALGDAAAFSFYPTKNLGALGDAGAVTTDDDALAERVRLLRNYGSKVKYQHEIEGFNTRLDPLQCALLRVKLAHLDRETQMRREIAARYLRELAGIERLRLPSVLPGTEPVWHLFVVRHPRRDDLRRELERRGIGTLIHYPVAPHQTEVYARQGWKAGDFPLSEELADTVLSLPMGPHLTPEMQDAVVAALRELV